MDERKKKPILAVDFDGVLHSYTSGWQGADVVGDPPVPEAIKFLREAVKHFTVCISSSRSREPDGIVAMREWLGRWALEQRESDDEDLAWLSEIEWPVFKPAAFLTIDDRAWRFLGWFPEPADLLDFKPWNRP